MLRWPIWCLFMGWLILMQLKWAEFTLNCLSQTFQNVFHRSKETDTFCKDSHSSGRVRYPVMWNMKMKYLGNENAPENSTSKIAAMVGTSRQTVWRILGDEQLHTSAHVQIVQELVLRVRFSQQLIEKLNENWQFLCYSPILFMDEASFSKRSIMNFHNEHLWADENPHVVRNSKSQHECALNIWNGIIGFFCNND